MHETREGGRSLKRFVTAAAGLCALTASLAAGLPAPTCLAAPRTAAMAIDANTGAVLHNRAGDAALYPASLTKMMTLYMTFELIKLGRLDYTSKIKMTEEGAAASPSKLGLKPGEEISVLHAIKALVTKSANDVAIAIAQHIGGSERNFARLMTRKAHEIGMSKTTFRNASGLPDTKQMTTARDMLTLALRLQDEFPQHYKLFATHAFTYDGHTFRNHNALLTRYRGTDGIKTGYTRASGFNLVTSVRRDGKHVVAAVFGGKTARVRNAQMRSLLDKALAKASTKVTRTPARFVRAPQPVPAKPPLRTVAEPASRPAASPPRSVVEAKPATAAAPSITLAKVRRVLIGPGPRAEPPADAARPEAQPVFAAASAGGSGSGESGTALPRFVPAADLLSTQSVPLPSTLEAQAAALERGGAPPAAAQPRTSRQSQATARPPRGPFAIQIGAYNDSADAEQHMAAARQRAGGLLDPYHAIAIPVQKGAGQLYRARFRGFDATAAASTCLHLRRLQIDCFVVKTQ
jgi:D-alanyl-D-alanine carboxypeptidase